uniref:Peptide synthetase n=1 Tax=uncultured bacterium esnapd14 TaxID=1366594 RepID=S5UBD6_9BACT|nr:peptide synthetase [uncultured bacterium esnapd14]
MEAMKSPAAVMVSPGQADLWRQVNQCPEPPATTPGALLRDVARKHADRPAVIAGRRELTYAELLGLAQTVAAQAQGDAMVVCVEPGWEQVVAVAAALLSGKRFTAINPGAPQSARWGQLADAPGRLVLTQSWLEERLRWPEGTHRICLDNLTAEPEETGEPPSDPAGVACLLPHPVTHDGLATPITDLIGRFGLGPDDRLLAVCPLGDDVAVSAILMMLLAGGALVVPDDIDLRTPAVWVDLMLRHDVTVWHSPPALAALLAEHLQQRGDDRPERLRLVLLGGEPFPLSLAHWLRRALGDRPRMVNLGPGAGAGIWSTCHELDEPDPRRGHLPIGVPLAATRAYILSDALVPCPAWVNGRLYVGGRLAAPAERSAAEVMGETVRATDHSGRLLPSGVLELGGEDATRITVSGHGFNLRDIEAALATHEDVLLAAAIEVGEGSVAFVKAGPGRQITGAQLLDYLRTKMSPYLLPERVELVGSFPLTPAGRVDRAALAARVAPRAQAPAASAPTAGTSTGSELMRRACALAAQVLDVSDVEPDMNLFDVGATSVQLVRIAVQAEAELGIQVDVEELLRFPSISVLVSFARPEGAATSTEWAQEGIILDPLERVAFKDRRPGVRHELSTTGGIDLPGGDADSLALRRTHRRFQTDQPVPRHALARLLGHLRRLNDSGNPKYAYPSAGSLYPVQTYVTVNSGRVEGLDEGSYYYHPELHRLVPITPGARIEAEAHAWVNRAAARESAFSLYLVAEQDAIAPMYGARARDYALIESGAMCQLLMSAATGCELGLCPVGEMDEAALREPLLRESHAVLHILLGGLPAEPDAAAEAEMLARVASI